MAGMKRTMRVMTTALSLVSLVTVSAVETLQSQIDYSSSSTVRPGRSGSTTSPPWPKLSLSKMTGSPTTPWGETHTRTVVGPETTTTESNEVEVEGEVEVGVEIVTPVMTVPGDQYQRHMLPYISDQTHWNTRGEHGETDTLPPARQQFRRIRRKEVEVVEVSIPKIFVDMAFTGHYSRISVPRSRVQ